MLNHTQLATEIAKLRQGQKYRPIVVAIISNDNHEFLLLESASRPGVWGFPQGGIEAGESVLDSFFRELQEEVGITTRELNQVSDCFYTGRREHGPERPDHRGFRQGKQYYYIIARYQGKGELRLQPEEVAQAAWVSVIKVKELLKTAPAEKAAISL